MFLIAIGTGAANIAIRVLRATRITGLAEVKKMAELLSEVRERPPRPVIGAYYTTILTTIFGL